MIRDARCILSDSQSITADAASTSYYDTGSTADVGPGNPLRLRCCVDESFTLLTHLEIAVETDDNASFSSPTKLFGTSVALSELTAGASIKLPAITGGCQRYLQGRYDVVGSAPTTGTISLEIILDVDANTSTPDAL